MFGSPTALCPVKARCCGVCRYSCTTAPCLCLGVDNSKSLPGYVVSLAQALQTVVQANDSQLLQAVPSLTCFRGQRIPPISIHDYIERTAKYSKCSPVCFIMAWSYLKRICGKGSTELAVSSLTVHRLVLTSVLIAVKMTDDRYYSNAVFAKIGGVTTSELNIMELKMLKLLDFRTHVPASEVTRLLSRLKALQGSGLVTSVLCRKRMTRSVDDLPACKHQELESDTVSSNAARSSQQSLSSLTAHTAGECQCRLAALQMQTDSAEMARAPSDVLSLPQLPCVAKEPCSLQANKSEALSVLASHAEVVV